MRYAMLLPIALVASMPLLAKDKKPDVQKAPEVFQKLVDCRAIQDPTARLTCYDEQVAQIDAAKQSGDLVVTDKASVKEARRGLFGFKLPSLKIFGGSDEDDSMKQIETTIASASQLRYGGWRIVLEDGAVWEQVDAQRLVFDPESGDKIEIKQGALGVFWAKVDGQSAIKVRRVE